MNFKKLRFVVPVAIIFALAVLSADAKTHRQLQGCVDSPENPTLVLGLVVAAAGYGFLRLRNRIAVRGNSSNS